MPTAKESVAKTHAPTPHRLARLQRAATRRAIFSSESRPIDSISSFLNGLISHLSPPVFSAHMVGPDVGGCGCAGLITRIRPDLTSGARP
jgi:hypothetical protein